MAVRGSLIKRKCPVSMVSVFLCCVFLCLHGTYAERSVSAAETKATETETIEELNHLYARSAVLMDGDSGRILYSKNGEEVLPMASTTKIMTCILALEMSEERAVCQVSANAACQPAVHLGMKEGENFFLEDLLYSMMLESHNDSAVCIAEYIGGSVEGFAELMNRKAKQIGCEHTHYITPNGLDAEDGAGVHSTTAGELARVLHYCICVSGKREEFLKITRTAEYRFADAAGNRSFYCVNHNALLSMMEEALCGKTGYTAKAGYCYVGALRRDGVTLIVALLACGWPAHKNYKWFDTKRLTEYGFSRYAKRDFDLSSFRLPSVNVLYGVKKEVTVEAAFPSLTVLAAEDETPEWSLRIQSCVEAPVEAGEAAGTAEASIGGVIVGEIPVVFVETDCRKDWSYCVSAVLQAFLNGPLTHKP